MLIRDYNMQSLICEKKSFFVNIFSQSYWDWLPPEIKEYVISLAVSQHIIDHRNDKLLCSLHEEILDHAKLVQEWGIGPINNVVRRCNYCQKVYLYGIYGCYFDSNDTYMKTYIASNYKDALECVDWVKSFLYPMSYYKYPNL